MILKSSPIFIFKAIVVVAVLAWRLLPNLEILERLFGDYRTAWWLTDCPATVLATVLVTVPATVPATVPTTVTATVMATV